MLQLRVCHSYDKSDVKNRKPWGGEVVLLWGDGKLRGLQKLVGRENLGVLCPLE